LLKNMKSQYVVFSYGNFILVVNISLSLTLPCWKVDLKMECEAIRNMSSSE
jgi:hypothetical protein